MPPPIAAMIPAIPPATMASTCLAPWLMPSASNTAIGVNKPPKWPKKMISTPTWNRIEPQTSCLRRSNWLELDFHVNGTVS